MLDSHKSGKYLFLSLFFAGNMIIAQESKVLEGKVTNEGKDVVGVVIQNITSEYAVVTDVDGNFSIRVSQSDTLVISAVQFKRKIIKIDTTIFSSNFITVPLEEFVNELKEVVVRPYNLSGDLNQDLGALVLEKSVSAETLKLPNAGIRIISQSENKLNDADHGRFLYFYGIGFAINVNKLLNRLSGRTKMLKNRVRLDEEYEKVKEIEEKFMDSLLVNHLKIPNDKFHDFIYYCQTDSKFLDLSNANDELLLWEFLVLKGRAYRENNSLD